MLTKEVMQKAIMRGYGWSSLAHALDVSEGEVSKGLKSSGGPAVYQKCAGSSVRRSHYSAMVTSFRDFVLSECDEIRARREREEEILRRFGWKVNQWGSLVYDPEEED